MVPPFKYCRNSYCRHDNALSRFMSKPREKIQANMRHQPCLCLCLGFSQIILILPFLLITLHFSQIGFTDDLTFTVILLSFVVRFPLLPETHRFRAIWERHYGLLYLYKKHLKMGIIQAFQQSSLEHYNTSLQENQAFLLVSDHFLQIVNGFFLPEKVIIWQGIILNCPSMYGP